MDELATLFDVDISVIENAFANHEADVVRMTMLQEYFDGIQAIQDRQPKGDAAPNNILMSNHAKYISTILTGYFVGNPIMYKAIEEEAQPSAEWINKYYRQKYTSAHDYLVGKHASIRGRAYELIYVNPDEEAEPDDIKLIDLDARNTFLIRDTDLERTVLGGIYYYQLPDETFKVFAYTDDVAVEYTTDAVDGDYEQVANTPHLFGGCPIIEYINNESSQGDFEQVISLIDAYNVLQSDRINDKEQLVDAILVITGGKMSREALEDLMVRKLLNLPDESMSAEWLTKSLDESGVEILKDSLKRDIHEFSFTPSISDENFAGTSSGEAMKFKLFGTEQVLQEKETYFEKSLRLRFKRIFKCLENISAGIFEYADISITFDHAMPNNLPNPIEIVNQTRGIVSDRTLYELLSFIENPEVEMERMAEQLAAESQRTQSTFEFPVVEETTVVDDET